jgi:fused signal recognition particle receptor
MFGFLKDKLKKAMGKFSKEVEKDAIVEKKEVVVEETPIPVEKPVEIIKEKKTERVVEQKIERIPTIEHKKTEPIEKPIDQKIEKKGFFEKIFGRKEPEEIIEQKEEIIEKLEEREIESIEEIKPVVESKKLKDTPKEEKIEEILSTEIVQKPQEIIRETPNAKLEHPKPTEIESKPIKHEIKETIHPTPQPKESEKKGFFTKITETFTKFNISQEKFDELFWDLEMAMLENNVAVEVIEKIKTDLKKELMSGKVARKGVEELIASTLKKSITELFDVDKRSLIHEINEKKKTGKPYIITIIGVNGSGKTTSLAKLTNLLQKQGLSVVLAASDTFRAAAIQQLEEHAQKLNTKIIKHDYHSDPAAVAFDAIKYAEAKHMDVVIIDTAGRLHSNTNLMEELKKVVRVCKPDIKIFVGESITGNDCVEQAKEFDKAVGIDAIILAKADIDEKGGAAISVSYVLHRPILYIGTGQTYDDLKEFNPDLIIQSLEL